MKDNICIIAIADQLPTHGVVIERSLCKCQKGRNTIRCKFRKMMYLCANFDNTDDH